MSCVYDVVVVGAGPSGLAAALSAARRGAHVLLIEQNKLIGGMFRDAANFPLCGLFPGGPTIPSQPLNEGIVREIFNDFKPQKRSAVRAMGRTFIWPVSLDEIVEWFKSRIDQNPEIQVNCRTRLKEVDVHDQQITALKLSRPDGDIAVTAKAVIDCSGCGAVVRLSRSEIISGSRKHGQLFGLSVKITGLVTNPMLSVIIPYELSRACETGRGPLYLRFTMFSQSEDGSGYLKMNAPANVSAKKIVRQAISILRERIPSFRDSAWELMSPKFLPRDGMRMKGKYVLTRDDVLSARKFEDEIAKGVWPIEYWHPIEGPRYEYLPEGEHYSIPARCLRSTNVFNLLAAGRCLSADAEAVASTRVIGTCITLGESAGRMATNLHKPSKS